MCMLTANGNSEHKETWGMKLDKYPTKYWPYLRNLTEEKPAWPSKTAANENPSRPSGRTTMSSSISSRAPCRVVEPHRIRASSVKEEDCASMAMAEQLLILAFTVKLLLLLALDVDLKLSWQLYLVNRNLCTCWLNKAMSVFFPGKVQSSYYYWVRNSRVGNEFQSSVKEYLMVTNRGVLGSARIRREWSSAFNWFNGLDSRWGWESLTMYYFDLPLDSFHVASDPTVRWDHKALDGRDSVALWKWDQNACDSPEQICQNLQFSA